MGRRPRWPPRDAPVLLSPMTGAILAASSLETFPSPAAPSSGPVPLKSQVPSLHPTTVSTHSCSYLRDSTLCLPPLPPQHCGHCPAGMAKFCLCLQTVGQGKLLKWYFLKSQQIAFSWETKIFFRILNFVALFTVLDCFYFELDRWVGRGDH